MMAPRYAEHVRCSRCGTRCSGVDPELGLVVRAWVECPECLQVDGPSVHEDALMRAVRVLISPELICQALRLPEGTSLYEVRMIPGGRWVNALFVRRDFDESLPPYPEARPTFEQSRTETQPAVIFLGWNIKA